MCRILQTPPSINTMNSNFIKLSMRAMNSNSFIIDVIMILASLAIYHTLLNLGDMLSDKNQPRKQPKV